MGRIFNPEAIYHGGKLEEFPPGAREVGASVFFLAIRQYVYAKTRSRLRKISLSSMLLIRTGFLPGNIGS
jgi:hypothetical protein